MRRPSRGNREKQTYKQYLVGANGLQRPQETWEWARLPCRKSQAQQDPPLRPQPSSLPHSQESPVDAQLPALNPELPRAARKARLPRDHVTPLYLHHMGPYLGQQGCGPSPRLRPGEAKWKFWIARVLVRRMKRLPKTGLG